MKKTRAFISLLAVIALFLTSIMPAYATPELSTLSKAKALYRLSILSGDGNNFNLTSLTKRSEAAVSIIRLMGKVDEAGATEGSHNDIGFSDVPNSAWYAAAVKYCAANGIMGAIESDKFKPDARISEKAYITSLLRVLGYKDSTDFVWSNVYQKAYEYGLVTDSVYKSKTADKTNFTRSDMIELLYNVVTVKIRNSEATLLDNLIMNGIVTRSEAKAAGFNLDKLATSFVSVVPVAFNKLALKFNENIQDITAADITIYNSKDTSKKLSVTTGSVQGADVVLTTGVQTADSVYTIEIKNVKDTEGNIIEKLTGTFKGYKPDKNDSNFFRIEKVEAESKNTVNVYFTHPVNANAEIASCYSIYDGDMAVVDGKSRNMSVNCINGVDNAVAISLNDFALSKDTAYIIKISGDMYSAYGVRVNDGEGDEAVFNGNDKDEPEINIEGITVTGSNSVMVAFNKQVDPFFGKQFLNYAITGPGNMNLGVTKAVIWGEGYSSGKLVTLTTQYSFDKSKLYTLTIYSLPDALKKTSINEKSFPFSGSYTTVSGQKGFSINTCQAIDSQTLEVYFSAAADAAEAENASNYQMTSSNSSCTPVKAVYYGNDGSFRVRLYFSADKAMVGNKIYRIRASKNLQGPAAYGSDVDYSFSGNGNAGMKPCINSASPISKDSIVVKFNKDITSDIPNILASNYILESVQNGYSVKRVPLLVGYIDSTTLVMKFDRLEVGTTYKLSFNNVRDFAGTLIKPSSDAPNYIEFTYKK